MTVHSPKRLNALAISMLRHHKQLMLLEEAKEAVPRWRLLRRSSLKWQIRRHRLGITWIRLYCRSALAASNVLTILLLVGVVFCIAQMWSIWKAYRNEARSNLMELAEPIRDSVLALEAEGRMPSGASNSADQATSRKGPMG